MRNDERRSSRWEERRSRDSASELERFFVRTKELGEEDFYCRIGTWCRCVDTTESFRLY